MAIRVQWSGNKEIAKMLDVSTAACSICKQPALVPEDVLAVRQEEDMPPEVIVVCQVCSRDESLWGPIVHQLKRRMTRDARGKA